MTTIAFDTSTTSTVAAVARDGVVAGVELEPPGGHPGHSGQLLTALEGLLRDAGAGWEDVLRIGVGTGPGTFTGVRIAAATAEGLRRSTGAPVVPVSSLEALAFPALGNEARKPVCSLIDARRGEVFAAGWSAASERLFGPVADGPEALVERLRGTGGDWRIAGRPPGPFADAIGEAGFIADAAHESISAAALCALTEAGQPAAGPVLPEYVREPDAVKPGA